ncbi:efflux RND transporter permease subunit [Treponema sp.]|uniref:efflux RND transporter permease subunit n=1 Tax=Treponema sp. TaxID=166 RepID=UPI00298DF15F|nr:MMPL family transporter [Treponema sp.]MCQ2241820.1 MMPL family transporter [Treponema sp.]
MKVTKINELFAKFGFFQIKHRFLFLIGLLIFTVISSAGLYRLKLDNGEDDWFDDWETTKLNQDHFEDIFGSCDSVIAFVQADDVFDPEVLEMLGRLGKRLENEIPYASSVTSLVNLSIPVGSEDGFEVTNPFEDGIPSDPKVLQEKKDFILSRESLVNALVSADATETFLVLNLEQYSENLETAMNKITPPAMAIFNDPEFKSDKYTIRPAGLSYTEYEEEQAMGNQCITRITIGFLVMVLCLILFIRSFRGVIVPALATVFGITSMLGLSAWMNIVGNTVMIVLVVLLAMALAVGYSVHYINSFKMAFRKTGNRRQSCIDGIRESGWAILFTVITTMGGMLSFYASGLRPMRWVAGISAACVFGVYLYVMLLLPIFYSFGKDRQPDPVASREGSTKADLRIADMGEHILNKKWITVIASIAIIAVCIPGICKIKINMNYSDMMGEKTPYIARLMTIARSQLGSQYGYEVLIEYPEENAIKNPQVLKNMDVLTERIGTLRQTKISNGKPRVSSVTKIIKEMNRTLNGDSPEAYVIPDDQELTSQLMFLYEISGGTDLYEYVNEDFSAAYLHVEMHSYEAESCVSDIAQVEQWVKELFPGTITGGVVGEVMQYAAMNGKLVRGSVKSIGTSFLIIFILLLFAFMSLRTGFIAMIPNAAPVILIGGIMGYAGVCLDMITALIMPMILGIAVDDTIHFTNHIKYQFELTGNYRKSILNSYREIGKSMIMTTVILCAMFAVFLTSSMSALVRIGYMSVIGMGGALVADYTLTPVLMLITKPFGKEKN